MPDRFAYLDRSYRHGALPAPPAYQGSSAAPGAGTQIARLFGGEASVKGINGTPAHSWINNPLPDNTGTDPLSSQAVSDLLLNLYDHATGTDPATEGGPSWGPVVAFPTFNYRNFTATTNIVDSSNVTGGWKTVYMDPLYSGRDYAYNQSTRAMMFAGFPIPDGLEPTNDGDSTLEIHDPDWVWPGDPTNQTYWGSEWSLWGAKSPTQNAARYAAGQIPLFYADKWTANVGGRMRGSLTRMSAHMVDRQSGADVANTTNPLFGAVAAPEDTLNPQGFVYQGFGQQGVAEISVWLASASHLPMSHHVVQIRDIINGVIRHPIGFSLFPMYPPSAGSKGFVWPATGYDGASRDWLKHGMRLRIAAGTSPTPRPAALPPEWNALYDMFFVAMRDYGLVMVDTTGNSFAIRGEPGIDNYLPLPAGKTSFDDNKFMKLLFQRVQDGTAPLSLIPVGSDSNYYPQAT